MTNSSAMEKLSFAVDKIWHVCILLLIWHQWRSCPLQWTRCGVVIRTDVIWGGGYIQVGNGEAVLCSGHCHHDGVSICRQVILLLLGLLVLVRLLRPRTAYPRRRRRRRRRGRKQVRPDLQALSCLGRAGVLCVCVYVCVICVIYIYIYIYIYIISLLYTYI